MQNIAPHLPDGVIIPTATTCEAAEAVMNSDNEDEYALDWFLRFRKDK